MEPIGTAVRCTTARGGLCSCSSRSQRSPLSAREISTSRAPATTASPWRRVAVALGGGVAEHLDAVGVEHEHALTQFVERGQQPVSLADGLVGVL